MYDPFFTSDDFVTVVRDRDDLSDGRPLSEGGNFTPELTEWLHLNAPGVLTSHRRRFSASGIETFIVFVFAKKEHQVFFELRWV